MATIREEKSKTMENGFVTIAFNNFFDKKKMLCLLARKTNEKRETWQKHKHVHIVCAEGMGKEQYAIAIAHSKWISRSITSSSS